MKIKSLIFEEVENIDKSERISIRLLDEIFDAFHLSTKFLGKEFVFTPRVSKNLYKDVDQNIIEDDITPRISVARRIEDALASLDGVYPNEEFFIYGMDTEKANKMFSTAKKIEDCPDDGESDYGLSFLMKKFLTKTLNLNDEESEELSQKKYSPKLLRKDLGDKFIGCVPDAKETNEYWLLEPTNFIFVGSLINSRYFYPSVEFKENYFSEEDLTESAGYNK